MHKPARYGEEAEVRGIGKRQMLTCPTTLVLPPPPSRTTPQTIQGRSRTPIEMCRASLTVGLGWKVSRQKSFCSQRVRGACFIFGLGVVESRDGRVEEWEKD